MAGDGQAAGCVLVRAAAATTGKQGLSYAPGISAETAGATGIHLELVRIPPGARAKAHKHDSHETAIYVLSGTAVTYWGERLEHATTAGAGDFMYIAPGVPHLPENLSATEPCVAVIARTDPRQQESTVLLPHLEALRAPAT